jgi:hypothetical protein
MSHDAAADGNSAPPQSIESPGNAHSSLLRQNGVSQSIFKPARQCKIH